jgi:hypothetical protein
MPTLQLNTKQGSNQQDMVHPEYIHTCHKQETWRITAMAVVMHVRAPRPPIGYWLIAQPYRTPALTQQHSLNMTSTASLRSQPFPGLFFTAGHSEMIWLQLSKYIAAPCSLQVNVLHNASDKTCSSTAAASSAMRNNTSKSMMIASIPTNDQCACKGVRHMFAWCNQLTTKELPLLGSCCHQPSMQWAVTASLQPRPALLLTPG